MQNGGGMVNHSKPLLDAPIPATVPVAAAPLAPATTSAAAPAPAPLPQPLLPTSQGQETKQERAWPTVFKQSVFLSVPPPLFILCSHDMYHSLFSKKSKGEGLLNMIYNYVSSI